MFHNIGKKIQGYAKLIFVIEVVLGICVVGGLGVLLCKMFSYDDEVVSVIGVVVVLLIAACIFFAWLAQMRLYAYGKIAESCEALMKTVERMEAVQQAQLPVHRCKKCGMVLDADAHFCPGCGTRYTE